MQNMNRPAANAPQSTTSLDLPPALAQLLAAPMLQSVPMPQQAPQQIPMNNMAPPPMPSYQMGGMVGPGGMPVRPQTAMPPGAGMPQPGMPGQQPGLQQPGGIDATENPQVLEAQVQDLIRRDPQQVQAIQVEIQQGLQSGEVTPESIQMIGQLAVVGLENPQMYPQIRQSLLQNGFLDEEDLPLDYNQGVMLLLYLIGKVGEQVISGGGQPMMSMKEGGPLPASSPKPDGSIPINAHEGEYVIPADVVRAKGTEFFDKLLQQYKQEGAAK